MKTIVLTAEGVKILMHRNDYDINDYLDDTFGAEVMWYSYEDNESIKPQVIALPEDIEEPLSPGEHIDNIQEYINQDGDDVTDEECWNQIKDYINSIK